MKQEKQKIIIGGCFEPVPYRLNVRIVAIGGGALNILNGFWSKSVQNLGFAAVDYDEDLLDLKTSVSKFGLNGMIGIETDRRLGFEEIRKAILDNMDDFGWLFRSSELVIIIICLGGETGSAIAPVLASIAGLEAELTIVFAVTPAEFEPAERHKRAETALKELEKVADTVIQIPMTDTRFSEETAVNPSEVFTRFDEIVLGAARAVTESLYSSEGLCCIDFPDLRTHFGANQKGYVANGSAIGEERATRVLENALGSENLLIGGAVLKDAKSVWLFIEGDESLCLDEVEAMISQVEDHCGESTDIIFAPVVNHRMNDNVRLTLLASGYD